MTRPVLVVLGVLLACGCGSDPTQLVVIVETDLPVPDRVAQVELTVIGPSGMEETFTEPVGSADAFPLTFGLRPRGSDLGPVEITARGRDGSGVEVVKTAASVTLERDQTRVLVLYLVQTCADMDAGSGCGAGRACRPTGCGPLEVPRSDLSVWQEDDDRCRYDRDADGDGSVDAPCGGPDCGWGNPAVRPGSTELCDRLDNDCNDSTDEGCGCTPVGTTEACTTTCGSSSIRTCEGSGNWGLCSPGAEVCNGIDDDCNGLTDDGTDWVVIRTVDVAGFATTPRIIRAGDQWSVAFHSTGDDPGVSLARVADDGTVTAPVLIASIDDASGPVVTWTGSGHALAYVEPNSYSCGCDPCTGACSTCTDHPLFLQLTDAAGMPTAKAQRIQDDVGGPERHRIAWSGSELAVSYYAGSIQLMRLDASGMMLDEMRVDSDRESPADLAGGGGQIALAWANDDLRFAFGPPEMLSLETIVVGRELGVRGVGAVLATVGSGWVSAYEDRNTNNISVVGIGADGIRLAGPMSVAPMAIFDPRYAVAGGTGQALVTWSGDTGVSSPGIDVVRVSADGMVVQPVLRVVSFTDAIPVEPSIAVAGATGAIAWSEDEMLRVAQIGCPGAAPPP